VTRIKVLVVDDSVVVRRLVSDALAEDPAIEVVGTASNGKIALSKLTTLDPDLVTLDIEMPVMDGLETLREIRKLKPRLPVVMFSTLTEAGASATLDALALGASDYVTKPANVGSVTLAMEAVRTELVPKVKALCGRAVGLVRPGRPVSFSATATTSGASPLPRTSAADPAPVFPAPSPKRRVEVVVIGSSTGGPNALAALWPHMPAELPVPVLIVQHMPPMFTRLLAERLSRSGPMPVHEATDGETLVRGHAYIAPGDHHMVIEATATGGRIRINQLPPVNSCRPSVDPLFQSATRAHRNGVLGVMLTGMGNDGLDGSRSIRESGGQMVVQDEATSIVWGMPGHVAEAGLADTVLPLPRIAAEIVGRVHVNRSLSSTGVLS
jgi:two-component system chemotaxis response regulator CheB